MEDAIAIIRRGCSLNCTNAIVELLDARIALQLEELDFEIREEGNKTNLYKMKDEYSSNCLAGLTKDRNAAVLSKKARKKLYKEYSDSIYPARGKFFIFMKGIGNSGKSVLGSFIRRLYPKESISSIRLKQMKNEFGMASLANAVINFDMDMPSSKIDEEAASRLKQITGGD